MEETKLADTLNKHWKNDKSAFGYRMLQKMGWTEDKGLGKNETGIVDSLKVKKREAGIGLGSEATTDGAGNRGWSYTAQSFDSVLNLLKEEYKNDKKDKKEKKEKKEKREKREKKNLPIISVGMK